MVLLSWFSSWIESSMSTIVNTCVKQFNFGDILVLLEGSNTLLLSGQKVPHSWANFLPDKYPTKGSDNCSLRRSKINNLSHFVKVEHLLLKRVVTVLETVNKLEECRKPREWSPRVAKTASGRANWRFSRSDTIVKWLMLKWWSFSHLARSKSDTSHNFLNEMVAVCL